MTTRAGAGRRLALSSLALVAITRSVHQDRVSGREAQLFRKVNGLPDCLYRPVWPVMQLGALGAAPAAATAALAYGDRRLAARLMLAGSATWALSKAFKRVVGRPRPAALVTGTRIRGADASGLGYLSGHAGVAVALAAAALPRCGPGARLLLCAVVPAVGGARMYVGAHLPLDVAAGAALGLGVEAAVYLMGGQEGVPRRCRRPVAPPGGAFCRFGQIRRQKGEQRRLDPQRGGTVSVAATAKKSRGAERRQRGEPWRW